MELCFENKTVPAYAETAHLKKTVEETGESVVPDTSDDIGKIVSTQTEVLLKAKEITPRGVSVTGETETTVVYITENAGGVSFVRTSKRFVIDYDIPDINEDSVSQIAFSVPNVKAGIVNPRKISLSYEITGELSVYTKTEVPIETILPDGSPDRGVHLKRENSELMLTTAAVEKTFAVSEQFSFPAGKPVPEKLIFEKAEFCVNDTQIIGTKAVARGEMKLEVTYLAQETGYPLKAEFSAPFSQIADIGDEASEISFSAVEICSGYFELADAANGEKIINAELHALLEVRTMRKQTCAYISDAYSNLLPSVCQRESIQLTGGVQARQLKLIADEKVNVAEDCTDILSIFTSASQPLVSGGEISCSVTIDIIYRTASGELNTVKRLINTRTDCVDEHCCIMRRQLADVYLRPEGTVVDVHAAVEVNVCSTELTESVRAVALTLNEDEPYDFESLPTLTLVRCEHNDMWEYARLYHSSVEEIESINTDIENLQGKLILIPKETLNNSSSASTE